jgi:hypothetical protein
MGRAVKQLRGVRGRMPRPRRSVRQSPCCDHFPARDLLRRHPRCECDRDAATWISCKPRGVETDPELLSNDGGLYMRASGEARAN